MADVPKKLDEVIQKECQAALVKAMSGPVRKIYLSSPTALAKDASYALTNRCLSFVVGDADMEQVLQPWVDVVEKRDEAERNLKNAVFGAATLKQLKTMLPEFVKYMPTESTPTANLPALANVAAGLAKLGWPKGEAA